MRLLFLSLIFGMVGAPLAQAEGKNLTLTSYLLEKSSETSLTYSSFRSAERSLAVQFDEICGDSFCEGEYSNIISVNFECLVRDDALVNQCQWHFFAYEDAVDEETGSLQRREQSFHCAVPFNGSIGELARFLAVVASNGASRNTFFDTMIPGPQPQTLYASLSRCFSN